MSEDELKELVKKAQAVFDKLPPEEKRAHLQAQCRSWVRGEMLLEHPEMTKEYVNHLLDTIGV